MIYLIPYYLAYVLCAQFVNETILINNITFSNTYIIKIIGRGSVFLSEIQDIILQKILEAIDIDDDGKLKIEGEKLSQYQRYFDLLKSELFDDKEFLKKMDDIRYYIPDSSNNFFIDGGINKIFVQMKIDDKHSFYDFMHHLYEKLDLIKKEMKILKFELYYPTNIKKLNTKINEINFRDIKVELLNYTDISGVFEDDKLKTDLKKINKFNKSKYQYIKVTLWCRNIDYAEQKSTKYVELILGFISYSIKYNMETLSFHGIPSPLIELELTYIFVFKESSYFNYAYFKDETTSKKLYELGVQDISNLNIALDAFNKSNYEVQEIISNAMSHYYEGLTERSIKYSFLNFWTVLEILTLKDENLSHYKVAKRLKSIIILDTLNEYKIDRLYALRNKLIHNGNTIKVSTIDRNLMKDYAELLVHFFIFTLSDFKLSEIGMIYTFLGKDTDYLSKSKKMIDKVIELRKSVTTTE